MKEKAFIRREKASISRPLVKKILDKLIEQREGLYEAGMDYKKVQSVISELCRELEDEELQYSLKRSQYNENELELDNLEDFFSSIISYQKDIDGQILRADKIPFIGVVVYNKDTDNERCKHFLIKLNKAKECLIGGCIIPQELKDIFPSVK